MSVETFIEKTFRKSSMDEIERASAIIADYAARGFVLTLRQLFYQFVSRALIANQTGEYKRLGVIVRDARRAGLIDWAAIEDRTRNLQSWQSFRGPKDAIDGRARTYAEDLWRGQRYRPEVWIEKDALTGVIEPACARWRLPSFAARGNGSDSELYRAGKRFALMRASGHIPIVLYFGDHDPTGLDATRDVRDRLAMFARGKVEVRRVALNMDQVTRYRPPPNPAKETDSRYSAYAREFGTESWELDALDPEVIDALIEAQITDLVDRSAWTSAVDQERSNRGLIGQVAARWSDVRDFLGNGNGGAS
jgi:hypothetical protein